MKRMLYILFFGCFLLFLTHETGTSSAAQAMRENEETVSEETAPQEQWSAQFRLSCDIQHNTCLNSRPLQLLNSFSFQRFSKNFFRQFHLFRLKEHNVQRQISESVSEQQATDYHSLLTCLGYRIYALRKIII